MTKYNLDKVEWYPIYSICRDEYGLGGTIELTDDEYKDWLRVLDAFNNWQARFRKDRI